MARSNFQRRQSKVWWGNMPETNFYGAGFYYSQTKQNVVQKEEEMDKTPEKTIINSWSSRQGSPSSHKSQDSGFSDSEVSPNMLSSEDKNILEKQPVADKLTPNKNVNEQLFQRSPSIRSEVSTPPTVIRRVPAHEPRAVSEVVSRRISYSKPSSPTGDLMSKINSFSFENTSPITSSQQSSPNSSCKCSRDRSIKRSRVITKNSRVKRNLSNQLIYSKEELDNSLNSNQSSDLLNRTLHDNDVSLGKAPKSILKSPTPYNNETVVFGTALNDTIKCDKELPTHSDLYPNGTSTPIMYNPKMYRSLPVTPTRTQRNAAKLRPTKLIDNFFNLPSESPNLESSPYSFTEYENPQLNGHTPAVQYWLDNMRFSYQSEVMSILQTKSISVEAARNLKITSATSVKLIRHVQIKVLAIQSELEKVEKLFASKSEEDFLKIPSIIQSLAGGIYEFVKKQESNNYYGNDKMEADAKKFTENTQSLQDMTTDLRIAAGNLEELDIKSIEDDVQIIKRYFLITIRLIFKRLIKVVVDTIDEAKCDLILRSNISYIAMLSNLDYSGLASLNDAFISNGTVRSLLIVCIESKYSSIRTLALRALATVCSTSETIRQLEKADGVEILKDILVDQNNDERSEPEFRETISVLTQITAPWHGVSHKIDVLKNYMHSLVEAITEMADKTSCCQTLLLCSACLNNLTRIEPTAIYSLMSHETISKLKTAIDKRGPGASIFLYEQITAMLFNMSSNKKSHHHLAYKNLINFMIQIFNQKFYVTYTTRAENDAHKRTIKNILHIFSRLINASVVGQDVLENCIIPIFSRVERSLDDKSEYFRDISYINKKFNDSLYFKAANINNNLGGSMAMPLPISIEKPNKIILLDKNRQESYV